MKEENELLDLLDIVKNVDNYIWESIDINEEIFQKLEEKKETIKRILEKNEDCKEWFEMIITLVKKLSDIILKQQETNLRIASNLQEEKAKAEILKEEKEKLYNDQLTGIWNRHKYEQVSEEFLLRYFEEWRKFSLSLLDIDDFKKINDTYWHWVWDRVLKAFATFVNWKLDKHSKMFRYGWEEFIILSLLSKEELKNKLNEIEKDLLTKFLKTREGHKIKFSFSGWVTEMKDEIKEIKELEEEADKLLYEAKRNWKKHVL